MKSINDKISEIQIIPIKPRNGHVGFANFLYDKSFYLWSIEIHMKRDGSGYRIAYPSKNLGDGKLYIFRPTNSVIGIAVEKAILKKAEEELGRV